jgi:hypothetical protein
MGGGEVVICMAWLEYIKNENFMGFHLITSLVFHEAL